MQDAAVDQGPALSGPQELRRRRIALPALLAVGLLLFLMPSVLQRYTPNTWLVGDGGFYLNMQKSLTRFGTLDQSRLHPHSWYSGKSEVGDAFSNVALGSDGEWWPKHSYMMPIAALPFYWLLGVDGTLVFNVAMILAMLVLAYHVARTFAPPGIAAAAAFLIGIGGPYQEYAYNYSNDGFYTVLLLGALLATLRDRHVAGGVLYGLAVWTKITCALLAPIYLAALLYRGLRRGWRPLLRFTAGGTVPMVMFALANWYMFGKPWVTSYQRVLVVVGGELTTASHTDLFTTPLGKGLREMFLKEHQGLLRAYPASVIAWLGFVPLLLRRRIRWIALAIMAVMVGYLWFFARFKFYHERFLFPYFGLMVVPAAVLMHQLIRGVMAAAPSPRLVGGLVALLLAAVAGARVHSALEQRNVYRLSEHIEQARVFLGADRCDYFNNMRWSWECARNRGDIEFVGVNAAHEHRFGGAEVTGYIFAAGHHTRRPRRLVFPEVPLQERLTLRYGLDDKSRPPFETEMVVHVGGRELHRLRLRRAGKLHETVLDTSAFAGESRDVVVTVRSKQEHGSRFIFDGWVPAP